MQFDVTPAAQGLCPPAWHIPTENDWNTLFANYINTGWDFNGIATFFWSSTSYGGYKAWAHGMNESDPSVSVYPASRVNAFSVRCIED
jgi:hypothetical protein